VGVDREVDTGVGLGNMNTSAAADKEQHTYIGAGVDSEAAASVEPKAGPFSLHSVADSVHNSQETDPIGHRKGMDEWVGLRSGEEGEGQTNRCPSLSR
jgi:hypothetical protein